MERDICVVVEEILDVVDLYFSADIPRIKYFKTNLIEVKKTAKSTAPEAMYLRWAELDKSIHWFLGIIGPEPNVDKIRSAYLRKWE